MLGMGTLYNKKLPPAHWQEPIAGWLGWLRAQGQRHATIDTKRRHLAYFARCNPDLHPFDLTAEYLLAWSATYAWKPETRHGYYGSFKSFLSWINQTTGQTRIVEMPRVRRPRTKARPVPENVLQQLLGSKDPRIALGSRLAASAGLRRSEIILTHVDDLVDDLVGRSLIVHGKGGTDRLVPLADGLDAAIRNHVTAFGITGYLFPGECDGHIGSTWLGKLINQQLPTPWNLHSLRHRFATTIYQQTKDLIVVQQLLGHESVATTQRYLAYNAEQLRRAVNLADAA